MNKVLGLLLSLSSAVAVADDAADLKNLLEPLQTLQGEFEQEVKDKNGEVVQASEGRFAIKSPGHFLWESRDPNAQLIVGTPAKLWVYDPDLEQATVREKEPYGEFNPSDLLSGNVGNLSDQFVVEKAKADKGGSLYVLTPKSESAQYRQVELQFKGSRPVAFSFADQLNQRSEVRFKDLTVNGKLDASVFEFTPPPGTDVLADE